MSGENIAQQVKQLLNDYLRYLAKLDELKKKEVELKTERKKYSSTESQYRKLTNEIRKVRKNMDEYMKIIDNIHTKISDLILEVLKEVKDKYPRFVIEKIDYDKYPDLVIRVFRFTLPAVYPIQFTKWAKYYDYPDIEIVCSYLTESVLEDLKGLVSYLEEKLRGTEIPLVIYVDRRHVTPMELAEKLHELGDVVEIVDYIVIKIL